MTTTPIRYLMQMEETCAARHQAVDSASNAEGLSHGDWAPGSRVWSRQQHAIASAIIAEPPQDFDDVLAVLTHLICRHDMIVGEGEDASELDLRDLREMTGVALKNCGLTLAATIRPQNEPTAALHESLAFIRKSRHDWLPPASATRAVEGER